MASASTSTEVSVVVGGGSDAREGLSRGEAGEGTCEEV